MAATRSPRRTVSSVSKLDAASCASRTDLLSWVNHRLKVNITEIELCANGAIYCQIVDACHPNSVAMHKVNWMAKSEHEYLPNYKILQLAFETNSIQKVIDINALWKAKNVDLLHFLKNYCERESVQNEDYDPVLARKGKSLPAWASSYQELASVAAQPMKRPPSRSRKATILATPRPKPPTVKAITRAAQTADAANSRISPSAGQASGINDAANFRISPSAGQASGINDAANSRPSSSAGQASRINDAQDLSRLTELERTSQHVKEELRRLKLVVLDFEALYKAELQHSTDLQTENTRLHAAMTHMTAIGQSAATQSNKGGLQATLEASTILPEESAIEGTTPCSTPPSLS